MRFVVRLRLWYGLTSAAIGYIPLDLAARNLTGWWFYVTVFLSVWGSLTIAGILVPEDAP